MDNLYFYYIFEKTPEEWREISKLVNGRNAH